MSPKSVIIDGQTFVPSPVFRTFFKFVAERHRVFRRRLAGEPQPWTNDGILQSYPFTNVFRCLDKVTQYILTTVIATGDQSLDETFFRVMLFRSFNKINTWDHLRSQLGELTWAHFDVDAYQTALENMQSTLYGAAYIIPAPDLGCAQNHGNHLRLIKMMVEDGVPAKLAQVDHLKDAHALLRAYPSMGDFTALQLLLDLNMTPHFNFDENEWVALGPGSSECLKKMFGPDIRGHELSAVLFLRDNQHTYFSHFAIPPHDVPRLCPDRLPGLTCVDIEHALCECEKYARAKHPNIVGKRTVPGRQYVSSGAPLTAEIPAHWLKPRPARDPLERPPALDESGLVYEVSHIVMEKRGVRGLKSRRYLVRWMGYGPEDDTWATEEELMDGSSEILEAWKRQKKGLEKRVLSAAARQRHSKPRTRQVVVVLDDH